MTVDQVVDASGLKRTKCQAVLERAVTAGYVLRATTGDPWQPLHLLSEQAGAGTHKPAGRAVPADRRRFSRSMTFQPEATPAEKLRFSRFSRLKRRLKQSHITKGVATILIVSAVLIFSP